MKQCTKPVKFHANKDRKFMSFAQRMKDAMSRASPVQSKFPLPHYIQQNPNKSKCVCISKNQEYAKEM